MEACADGGLCSCVLVDSQPDTQDVDQSEIRTQILLATASSTLRGRNSFTHMLTEVLPPLTGCVKPAHRGTAPFSRLC